MQSTSNPRTTSLAIVVVVAAALAAIGFVLTASPQASAQADASLPSLVINEWNAVSSESVPVEGDSRLGKILGNGGDWIELVVVQDHADLRNWSISISVTTADGPATSTISFTDNALWADVRAGTIITIAEEAITSSDGTTYGEDVSFDPASGDWWINVVAGDTGTGTFVEPTRFRVTSNNWQASIRRADGNIDFGPIGEGIGTLVDGGISSDEIGELEEDPSPLIDPATAAYDDGNGSTFGSPNAFNERLQNMEPLRSLVTTPDADCADLVATVDLALGQLPTEGDDIIFGTSGDDIIGGLGGDDIICGLGGNDQIFGQAGNDTIFGGPGNDKLRGGNGNDTVRGGDGEDDVAGGRDNDFVYGGPGDDPIVRGNTGDDTVDGGPGNDKLVAGNGGQDIVTGGPGNDKVTGGPRPDTVSGGPGDDEVKGNKGADTINGDDGNDDLRGGPQPDTLDGGTGTDACSGGSTGDGAVESDQAVNCETVTFVP